MSANRNLCLDCEEKRCLFNDGWFVLTGAGAAGVRLVSEKEEDPQRAEPSTIGDCEEHLEVA